MKRILYMCLALLALAAGGCQARPAAGSAAPAQAQAEAPSTAPEASKAPSAPAAAGEPAQEPALSQEEAEAVVAAMLEKEGLIYLLQYFPLNFDKPEELAVKENAIQMLWGVFKWYELQPGYKAPAAPDYPGYSQVDSKTMRRLCKRWFGVEEPAYEGNEKTLGDVATGELVNFSPTKKNYYFIEAEIPLTEAGVLKSAKAGGGTITAKIDAVDPATQAYLRTYIVKLCPAKDGTYYLCSVNRGQA